MQNEWANEQRNAESMTSINNILLLKEGKPWRKVTTSTMERNSKNSFQPKTIALYFRIMLGKDLTLYVGCGQYWLRSKCGVWVKNQDALLTCTNSWFQVPCQQSLWDPWLTATLLSLLERVLTLCFVIWFMYRNSRLTLSFLAAHFHT
jgi:hypothetical protein